MLELNAPEFPIKGVTIFGQSSKAEVVRTFDVDLQKGSNKIVIQELPSSIDTESVRISGLDNVRLADVVCTNTVRSGVPVFGQRQSEALRALLQQKSSIESRKRVHEHEADLLVSYGKTLHGDHVHPKDFEAFLTSFVEQGKKNLTSLDAYTTQILRLEKEINEQVKKDNESFDTGVKQGRQDGRVEVTLSSQADIKNLKLQITYMVSRVIWEPTYELHAVTDATSGKPSSALTLHYRARITQSTGEDWNGTRLTLSTVSVDSLFKSIPRVRPLKVRPTPGPAFQRFRGTTAPFGVPVNNTQTQATGPIFGQTADPSIFKQPLGFGLNNTSHKPFGNPQTNLFGQANNQSAWQQQQQTTSLFGAPAQQTQSQSSAGLFGSAPPSSAFGASSVQQAQAQPSASQFGSVPSSNAFSAFGNSSAQQAQAQPSTGLFGSAPAQSPPVQQAQLQPSANLFGSAPAFGGPVPQAQSLFGTTTTSSMSTPAGLTDVQSQEADEGFEEVVVPLSSGGDVASTVVTETPLAISFVVDGESTIPSDGLPHQAEIAKLDFEGKVEHVVVPRTDATVYLQCQVKNTSEYRLLPGPVTVLLNDGYVSKTSISDINTNDTFVCTLGADTAVKVTYARKSSTKKTSGGAFSEVRNITTFTSTITIQNKHQFPLTNISVRDVIPTSGDDRIKVILRKPEGLAHLKDGDALNLISIGDGLKVKWSKLNQDGTGGEKEGKFEWLWSVGAGERIVLLSEWEVTAPADMTLSEFVAGN